MDALVKSDVPQAVNLGKVYWCGFKTIIIREYGRIIRIWGQTLVPPAVQATLYFTIFGSLIGRRVGQLGGYDYVQFVAPGLIIMSVIQTSYGNVVSSFFGAKFGKHIEELLVSPLPNWLIVAGYTAGGLLRGVLVGCVVTVVSLLFSRIPLLHPFIVISAAVITSIVFSLGGFINALLAKNFDQVNWIPAFVLTPLTYFGGVFYSMHMLPAWAQKLSYANPIMHMVNAFRYGFLGVSDVDIPSAFVISIGLGAALFTAAVMMMNAGRGIRD
jgi:ABC-2 type transport system permease protein